MIRRLSFLLALGIALVDQPASADTPDAEAVVRSIRAQEAWIDRVDSLSLKAEVTWKRTPQWIAHRRRELQKQFPGKNLDDHSELQPVGVQQVEMAFDRERVRLRELWPWDVEDLRVWDGKRFISYIHQERAPERDAYALDPSPARGLNYLLSDFTSFSAAPHAFWWNGPKERDEILSYTSPAEGFAYAGRDTFEDTECDVFCRWGSWDRFYVADGRLRGLKIGTQTRPDFSARIMDFLRTEGKVFRDEKEWGEWYRSLSPDEARKVDLKLSANMLKLTDPIFEFGLTDYKEIAPGCWLPMTQTVVFRFIDEDGSNAVEQTKVLKVTEARVNERLPDSLFAVALKEGAQIIDRTHNPPLEYRQKDSFTPEEWSAIVARGKERAERDQAYDRRQHALIGRPVPEFPATATWLNGGPLRWPDLAGKVVVLDFWAEWCGPCRNDLPTLSDVHRARGENGLVVIGVHPPGSEPEAIRKVMKEFDLGYPICVDVRPPQGATTWGRLYEQLGVDRIPHAVLVDRRGTIVTTGELNEVLLKALELGKESP